MMCGLFGMISKVPKFKFTLGETWNLFDMAVITSLRGRDSSSMWGIHRTRRNSDPRIWKTLGDPYNLINTKAGGQIQKFMMDDATVIFGHGRKATLGKVTLQNAHPFKHKNITLMHNGTINSGLESEDKTEVEVDSHALTILVQEKGVSEALAQVEGAFAIIAYDTNKQRILISRNYQRPLHYAEGTDMIFIMSDRRALDYVLERAGRLQLAIRDFEPMKVYEIDPEHPTMDQVTHITKSYSVHTSCNGDTWEQWNRRKGLALPPPKDEPKTKLKAVSYDDSSWKLKRNKIVRFVVEDLSQTSGNNVMWRYSCVDTAGNKLVFFHPDMHADWLDRRGEAPVIAAHPEKTDVEHPELTYIINRKDIDWLPEWSDLTEVEKITVLKDTKCYYCSQAFVQADIHDMVILKRRPLEVMHGECDTNMQEVNAVISEAGDADHISV
jgi:predicted glutamine amidotransferase